MADNRQERVVVNAKETGDNKNASKYRKTLPKIVSVLLAFILWLYVVTVETPINEKTFTNIEIKLTDAVNGLSVLAGAGNFVDVTVRGKKSDLDRLSEADFAATIDISGHTEAGEYELPVKVVTPSGATFVKQSIKKTYVKLDEEISKSVPVKAEPLDWQCDSGYSLGLGEIAVTPAHITVTGPKTELDKIDQAFIEVDCDGIVKEDLDRKNAKFNLLDKSGNKVTNPYVTTNVSTADVFIPLNFKKTVYIKAVFADKPDESDDIVLSKETVEIHGRASDFPANTDYVTTSRISLENVITQTVKVAIAYPNGIEPTDQSIKEVDVTVTRKGWSEKVLKPEITYILPEGKESTGVKGSASEIKLVGKTENIEAISTKDVILSVDLSGVINKPGEHTLEAQFALTNGMILEKDVFLMGDAVTVTVNIP